MNEEYRSISGAIPNWVITHDDYFYRIEFQVIEKKRGDLQ
jgi:hypothetical protein